MKHKVKRLHFVADKARNGKPSLEAVHALPRVTADADEGRYAA